MAAEVNQALSDRLNALGLVATNVTPDLFDNPAAISLLLTQRPALQAMFNSGLFVVWQDGSVGASNPLAVSELRVNVLDKESIAATLKDGRAAIGQPHLNPVSHTAVFAMTAPIRDARGQVIGALAGVMDLGQPNFLDRLAQSGEGQSGTYLIAAPQHQLFITASDKSRVMQQRMLLATLLLTLLAGGLTWRLQPHAGNPGATRGHAAANYGHLQRRDFSG